MLGGVCGGVAEYFEIDVAIVRILTVLLGLFNGVGVLIYVVALFIIPTNPSEADYQSSSDRNQTLWLIVGGVLILAGAAYLFDNFHFFPYGFQINRWGFDWDVVWPLLLIGLGIFYIIYISKEKKEKTTTSSSGEAKVNIQNGKRLLRSKYDRKIAGVCGGLAIYFNIDPTIVRVLFVVLTLFAFNIFGVLAYFVMAIVVPEEDLQTESSGSSGGENK